jgi:aspartyl-tRNA(Asn)/glutamyl-tRNA(Gln) amidotransferase subunit A
LFLNLVCGNVAREACEKVEAARTALIEGREGRVPADILRQMVTAIGHLRSEAMDPDQIEEWAARLEEHVAELEFLTTQAVSDTVEPAFEASPWGPPKPAATPAGPIGPAGELAAVAEQSADATATVRPTPGAGGQISGIALAPLAALNQRSQMTLVAALQLFRTHQLSPAELVEQHLERIRQAQALNVFIAVFEDQARREAHAAERALASGSAGLLAGIPLAVKDLMHMRGYAMTGGSRALDEVPSPTDGDVVARLRAAGAVILGAANLHELAYGVTSENPHFGAVNNPRRPQHMAGGSSGGSAAAVAAHLALGAIGTDTGGSIRIPAAACGVVGLKPTYGRVTRRGVLPLSWSLDHVGPLAATCADAAVLLAVMADDPLQEEQAFAKAVIARSVPPQDERALSSGPAAAAWLAQAMGGDADVATHEAGGVRQSFPQARVAMARVRDALVGLRVGQPCDEWLHPLQDDVASAWRTALERLREAGALVSVVEPPSMLSIRAAQFVVLHSEATAFHRKRLRQRAADLGPDVRMRLQLGEFLMAVDYVQGQRLRRRVADAFRRLFDRVDVLVLPALPVAAPPLGTRLIAVGDRVEPVHRALTRYTAAFNQSGLPAVVVPVGTDARGLPLSVQIAGRPFGELDILRVGIALETLDRLP